MARLMVDRQTLLVFFDTELALAIEKYVVLECLLVDLMCYLRRGHLDIYNVLSVCRLN